MSRGIDLSSYVDVAARIVEFRTKHPEGSLQPADVATPFQVVEIGGQTYIAVVAAAYRSPADTRPGIGMAYEQFPGQTPYTRGSELQNAETSAWGRAIVAALAADTRQGVASRDEVQNRVAEREQSDHTRLNVIANARKEIDIADSVERLDHLAERVDRCEKNGLITAEDADHLRGLLLLRHEDITGITHQEDPE